MPRISDDEAFQELDVVETDFSGKWTTHIVVRRFKTNSQSGVCYEVLPTVPKSGEGGRMGRVDHGWFVKIGRAAFDGKGLKFEEVVV